MALIAILRNAGVTMARAPLLWFFSAVVLVTNDLLSIVQNTSFWLGCLSLLLIPITVLAQAGQIRSVQLFHQGATTSISQVIQQGRRRLGSLVVLLGVTLLLTLILAGTLWFVLRLLLPLVPRPNLLLLVFGISGPIADAFMTFAQRGIVVSDLRLGASLPMVLRVLRKDALTVVVIVIVFGLLRQFIRIHFPMSASSLPVVVGYLLALLIVGAAQSAVFTFAYLRYSEGAQGGGAVAELDAERDWRPNA